MNHIQQLKVLLIHTAKYYGYNLSDEQILMYAADLEHLPIEEAAMMLKAWRMDKNHKSYPRPAELLAYAGHTDSSSPEDRANIATNKIWSLVSKWGWPNAKYAIREMNELEQATVSMAGGWTQVCEDANNTDPGIFKAQLRNLALAADHRSNFKQTLLTDRKEAEGVKTIANGVLKSIEDI